MTAQPQSPSRSSRTASPPLGHGASSSGNVMRPTQLPSGSGSSVQPSRAVERQRPGRSVGCTDRCIASNPCARRPGRASAISARPTPRPCAVGSTAIASTPKDRRGTPSGSSGCGGPATAQPAGGRPRLTPAPADAAQQDAGPSQEPRRQEPPFGLHEPDRGPPEHPTEQEADDASRRRAPPARSGRAGRSAATGSCDGPPRLPARRARCRGRRPGAAGRPRPRSASAASRTTIGAHRRSHRGQQQRQLVLPPRAGPAATTTAPRAPWRGRERRRSDPGPQQAEDRLGHRVVVAGRRPARRRAPSLTQRGDPADRGRDGDQTRRACLQQADGHVVDGVGVQEDVAVGERLGLRLGEHVAGEARSARPRPAASASATVASSRPWSAPPITIVTSGTCSATRCQHTHRHRRVVVLVEGPHPQQRRAGVVR